MSPLFYLISMNEIMTKLLNIFCLCLLIANFSFAAETVSRAEYDALLQRVEVLESVLEEVQVDQLATLASLQLDTSKSISDSPFIDNVVSVLQEREEDVNYPWMDAEKWAQLNVGMTSVEVLALLGDPTMNDPSLHKRIDFFYTYQGRRVATRQWSKGLIRFYRNKIVSFDLPNL